MVSLNVEILKDVVAEVLNIPVVVDMATNDKPNPELEMVRNSKKDLSFLRKPPSFPSLSMVTL